jgi:hypothetical protein
MLIKRNVYFSAVDQETGEERLFSVNEIMTEEEYLERLYSETEAEQVEFSKKKKEKKGPKLTVGDKVGIWTAKHLQTKKDREAMIEAYDRDKGDYHKLGKQSAKYAAASLGLGGAALGAATKNVKGAALGAAVGSVAGGLAGYTTTRLDGAADKVIRKVSTSYDNQLQRTADRNKVASGKMTKEEYAKKYHS